MNSFTVLLISLLTVGLSNAQLNCGLNEYDDGVSPECVCIPDYTRVQAGVCCGVNEVYNNASNTCDCRNGFIREPVAGICQCPDFQMVYNTTIGCECMTGLYNDSTGHCCPPDEVFNGTVCDCLPTLSRDANGICTCFGLNEQKSNGQCVCVPGTSRLPSGLCCGVHERDVNGTCVCELGFITDPLSDLCVCPSNQLLNASGICVCPADFYRDPNSSLCCYKLEQEANGTCVCKPPLVRNPISQECICPTNSVYNGNTCDCIVTFEREPVTGICCGPNQIPNSASSCECKPTFDWGAVTGHCLCKPHSSIANGTCVCDSGFIRDSAGECACPDREILVNDTCICNATKGHVRDPVTHLCGCEPHEIFINDFCQCAIGFVRNNITGQCQPINGWTFEPAPVICSNNATLLNCTYLIPYRPRNLTDAIENLFGRIFVIVEWNYGNINNIVVQFFNDIINIIGVPSQSLKDKIVLFLNDTVLSCPYELAAVSSCSNVHITLVSDMDIYILSQQFGQDLVAYPCPV